MSDPAEEMAERLVQHCRIMAHYWATLPEVDPATGKALTITDRCEGVAFSILAGLDGCSGDLPPFVLIAKDDFGNDMEIDEMLHERFGRIMG